MSKGQVEIFSEYNKNCPIYLYTHSKGQNLVNIVYEVLSMKRRWDDSDYLTRMIFCAMVPKDSWFDEHGYGIGTSMYDDLDILISLNISDKTIKMQSSSELHTYEKMSFDDFVNVFYNGANL